MVNKTCFNEGKLELISSSSRSRQPVKQALAVLGLTVIAYTRCLASMVEAVQSGSAGCDGAPESRRRPSFTLGSTRTVMGLERITGYCI